MTWISEDEDEASDSALRIAISSDDLWKTDWNQKYSGATLRLILFLISGISLWAQVYQRRKTNVDPMASASANYTLNLT